jgi:hypothetical protein
VTRLPTTRLLRYGHEKVARPPFTYTAVILHSTVLPSEATSNFSNTTHHQVAWKYTTVSPNR